MLMKKMKYEKPSIKVVVLSNRSQLLAGSNYSAGFGGHYGDTGYYEDSYWLDESGEDL